MKRSYLVLLIILLVLLMDQSLKIWVKTHMEYGEYFKILGLNWARIHFVENPGMAFGIELGGDYGKLALSLFRIGAVIFLGYYIGQLIKMKVSVGLLVSFALILAGALGNILDSAFYGLIFSESSYHGGLAQLFPPEGGYAGFLHGRVVDMFHFPMIKGTFPDWFPLWSGQYFEFFRPVFNLADSAITVGVFNIILFQRSFFATESNDTTDQKSTEVSADKEQITEHSESSEIPSASTTTTDNPPTDNNKID